MKRLLLFLLLLPCCYKEPVYRMEKLQVAFSHKWLFDFELKNETNKTIYAVCFYYGMRESGLRWMWQKSAVVKLEPNDKKKMHLHTLNKDIKNLVHGSLATFDNEEDANNSIFELLTDFQILELPLLKDIKGKTLILKIDPYASKGRNLYYKIIDNEMKYSDINLDFYVENKSNEDIIIASFIYKKYTTQEQWSFYKTDVIEIKNGEQKLIPAGYVENKYDEGNIRGYLGIFKKDEYQKAKDSTFFLLNSKEKLEIGKLTNYKDKKVVIIPSTYKNLSKYKQIRYSQFEYIRENLKNDKEYKHHSQNRSY